MWSRLLFRIARLVWLLCASLAVYYGHFYLPSLGQRPEAALVGTLWALLFLGFPSALIGLWVSMVPMMVIGALLPPNEYSVSFARFAIYASMVGCGYWQWFVWLPRKTGKGR